MTGAPMIFRTFGTGADGAVACTTSITGGIHNYTNFTVAAGQTCTESTNAQGTIILATGTCTIAGTLSLGGVTNAATVFGDMGGSGGSGGSGSGNSSAGGTDTWMGAVTGGGASPFPAGGAASSSGAGNDGSAMGAANLNLMVDAGFGWFNQFRGGSAGSQGGSTGGARGLGGQPLVMICNTINFTGVIDVSGQNGTYPAGNSTGAGGGGGAGYAVLSAITYTNNTGQILLSGGPGAGCSVPEVFVWGVSGKDAYMHIAAGQLSGGVPSGAVTIDSGGSGYGANPTNCLVLGGGGSGATCTCTANAGAINSCTVSGGTGYTATTYSTCSQGGYGGPGWSRTYTIQ